MGDSLALVCGLPNSGNRLLVARIKAAVQQTSRWPRTCDMSVRLYHGDPELPRRPAADYGTVFVVVPVRNPRCRVLSMRREGKDPNRFPEEVLRKRVCRLVVEGAFMHLLSYEAMVQDPDAVGAELFAFLGLDAVPLETFDANARYG